MAHDFRNEEGYRRIFEEYYGALCNYSLRFVGDRSVAEDTVQSVFIRLWEGRHSIRITGSLKSYLFNSVRNASLDYIRAQKRQEKLLSMSGRSEEDAPVSESDADMQVFRYKLHEAIGKLKPKTQEIFLLHKMEGLTYNEISEHLNLPRRTVEYNIYAALTQLKRRLKADYDKYVAA